MAVTNVNKVGTTFFTDINDISWKFQFSMCQYWLWQQSPLSKDSFVTVIGDIFKMSPMAVTKEPSVILLQHIVEITEIYPHPLQKIFREINS